MPDGGIRFSHVAEMMFNSEFSPAARYLVAFLSPVLVAVAMAQSWPLFEANPITIYLLAVVVSAWIGGFSQGVIALLISFALANYVFIAPYYELGAPRFDNTVRMLTVGPLGVFISLVCELMQRGKRCAGVIIANGSKPRSQFSRDAREYDGGLQDHLPRLTVPLFERGGGVRKPVDFEQFLEAAKQPDLYRRVLTEPTASE